MTDPEHFLSRWSRKKHEEKREAQQEEKREDLQEAHAPPAQASESAPGAAPKQGAGLDEPSDAARPATSTPGFDLASLPPIESIGANTDIRPFLQPGVPADMRNAALRRAWSVDPAIRDFKGLQENDWDFNDPNGILGFGPLSPDIDVKKMVASLFGETRRADSVGAAEKTDEQGQQATALGEKLADAGDGGTADTAPAESDGDVRPDASAEQNKFVQRTENIAPQEKKSESESLHTKHRRPRGGALPQS